MKLLSAVVLVIFAIIETIFFKAIGDINPELDFLMGQLTIIVINIVAVLCGIKVAEEERR